ncbi:MAG TPA: hypothetical protein VM537_31320, partial [Anaerolineae bacterium]|nr:hypothetical protein [Anaerolineae bacterium]
MTRPRPWAILVCWRVAMAGGARAVKNLAPAWERVGIGKDRATSHTVKGRRQVRLGALISLLIAGSALSCRPPEAPAPTVIVASQPTAAAEAPPVSTSATEESAAPVSPLPTVTPSPTTTATDSPTPSPTVTPTATATASPTPSPTASPTATSTATSTPSATPTPTATPSPAATSTPAPTPGPTPDGQRRQVRVPILMYHYISSPPPGADAIRLDLSVSPARFASHLQALKDAGYQSITL